jgi:hypothetical protein
MTINRCFLFICREEETFSKYRTLMYLTAGGVWLNKNIFNSGKGWSVEFSDRLQYYSAQFG